MKRKLTLSIDESTYLLMIESQINISEFLETCFKIIYLNKYKGHEWKCKGKLGRASCPSCGRIRKIYE